MKPATTIKLSKKTADILSRLKIHPRQTYEEVILKLVSDSRRIERKPKRELHPIAAKDATTIKLSKKTADILSRLKIHPRQPYEEVILNLTLGEKIKNDE